MLVRVLLAIVCLIIGASLALPASVPGLVGGFEGDRAVATVEPADVTLVGGPGAACAESAPAATCGYVVTIAYGRSGMAPSAVLELLIWPLAPQPADRPDPGGSNPAI